MKVDIFIIYLHLSRIFHSNNQNCDGFVLFDRLNVIKKSILSFGPRKYLEAQVLPYILIVNRQLADVLYSFLDMFVCQLIG